MHTFTRVAQGNGDYTFCVGYWVRAYNDHTAKWHPLRDCNTAAEAAMWVNFLNGGAWPLNYVAFREHWEHGEEESA